MPEQRTAAPAASAGELLSAYRPGDAFFSTATGALHGTGALHTLDRIDDLPATLADAGPGAVAMGAIPFDTSRPAHLSSPGPCVARPRPPKGRHPRTAGGHWGRGGG